MNIGAVVAALLLAATAGAAGAQQRIAPGLWEHTMTVQGSSAQTERSLQQMQQQMAALPAEQRRMMEQMRARQGADTQAAERASTTRVCISPEQARRGELPRDGGDCQHRIIKGSGSTLHYTFSCAGAVRSSGEGETTLISDKAYKGIGVITLQLDGRDESMRISHAGKWIGADCGSIKPAG